MKVRLETLPPADAIRAGRTLDQYAAFTFSGSMRDTIRKMADKYSG